MLFAVLLRFLPFTFFCIAATRVTSTRLYDITRATTSYLAHALSTPLYKSHRLLASALRTVTPSQTPPHNNCNLIDPRYLLFFSNLPNMSSFSIPEPDPASAHRWELRACTSADFGRSHFFVSFNFVFRSHDLHTAITVD